MFSKVLAACLVLHTVQVFGGSIKPKLPAEVQHLVQQIDMKAILLENDIKTASVERKHEMDLVKMNNKMALKQLKNAIKASKGGDAVCTQIANLESRAIEQRANEAKMCDDKLDLKALQHNLHGYLKNLHEEAMLVDKYCAFINPSEDDRTQCVTDSVAALEAKLSDVQTVISIGMTNYQNQSESCLKSVLDDVQLGSASIQIKLRDCLNPSTEASVESEAPAQDGSSAESQDSQSSESSANNTSDGSGSHELGEVPSDAETEDGNGGNNGGEGENQEQTTDIQDGEDENNNDEDIITGVDHESHENDKENNVNDDQKQESGNDATQAAADPEKAADKEPTEEQPSNDKNDNKNANTNKSTENNKDAAAEDNSAKDTPVEDIPVDNNNTNASAEKVPADDKRNADEEKAPAKENFSSQQPEMDDDDEINIEY